MELSNLLQQAIDHHQQGHLEEAERLYRAILQVAPATTTPTTFWANLPVSGGSPGRHCPI